MRDALFGALAVSAALFSGWFVIGRCRHPITVRVSGNRSGDPNRRSILPSGRSVRARRKGAVNPALELQYAAYLVAQLGALLRAGRTPEQMWRQAAETHALACGPSRAHRTSSDRAAIDAAASRALSAAAHAAGLGRPVAAAIREAVLRPPGAGTCRTGAEIGVWTSVASCIETAEASGSPLAGVLDRLAIQLESDADAAGARAVALAGPRATARVLSVLPIAGLGLGMLMGADPLSTLLATPMGSWCLGLGCALTAAGRWWSARLVRSASEAR